MTLIDTVGSTLGGTQEEVEICCNNKKEDCNKHSNSVTPAKSLKGIYLRSLQHRDDMIMALVDRIMSTNHLLMQVNTNLELASKQFDNKCCCNCINNKDMSIQRQQPPQQRCIHPIIGETVLPPPPQLQPINQPVLGRNNEGFPPSSVEQALKSGFERIVPADIAETKMGEQLTTTMIQELLKNPSIITKLMEMGMNAEKNNINKDLLLSKPEQFKKASQEIVNKSLTKEDENQLEELAARIDKQEKELKEQEIQNFLQSSVETDI